MLNENNKFLMDDQDLINVVVSDNLFKGYDRLKSYKNFFVVYDDCKGYAAVTFTKPHEKGSPFDKWNNPCVRELNAFYKSFIYPKHIVCDMMKNFEDTNFKKQVDGNEELKKLLYV